MEAALEPAHTARSRRRSSCPAVWIDRQLTGRSAALRRHHAALPSEDTPRARCAAARSVIPHSPDAKVLTLDQGHVTICHNPSVHRTPCCPGVTQMVQGIKVCTVRWVYGGVVSLYVRSCESSSSWRAAASSDAIEDLPTPDGPQRRISWPAAPPLCFATPAGMFGQDSALRKTADKEIRAPITVFWHFSQKACKTNSKQTNIVPVRQHRRQNGPVVVAVSRLEVTYLL